MPRGDATSGDRTNTGRLGGCTQVAPKPNIIFILTDDLSKNLVPWSRGPTDEAARTARAGRRDRQAAALGNNPNRARLHAVSDIF